MVYSHCIFLLLTTRRKPPDGDNNVPLIFQLLLQTSWKICASHLWREGIKSLRSLAVPVPLLHGALAHHHDVLPELEHLGVALHHLVQLVHGQAQRDTDLVVKHLLLLVASGLDHLDDRYGGDDVLDNGDEDLIDDGFHLEDRLEETEVAESARLVVKLLPLRILFVFIFLKFGALVP